jgi:hypothetical protein
VIGLIAATLGVAGWTPVDRPPQINVVIRVQNPAAVDQVVTDLANHLHMQMTTSGEGVIAPIGAHGYQVYDERITILILPAPVDACSHDAVYDNRTFSVGIVAVRADAEHDLPQAARELRNVVGAIGGSVSEVTTCTAPR